MTTPALFTIVEINCRSYRLQDVQQLDGGAQTWMLSRVGNGSMYTVTVQADGSFGSVAFAY